VACRDRRVQTQPYAAALVVGVTEAEGDAPDVLDDAVVALGAGVGQAGLQCGDDGGLPGLDGAGEFDDLGYLSGGAESVEPLQRGADLVAQPAPLSARE
jgi:hypothetical protein